MTIHKPDQKISALDLIVEMNREVGHFLQLMEELDFYINYDIVPIWKDGKGPESLGSRLTITVERMYRGKGSDQAPRGFPLSSSEPRPSDR